MDRHNLRAAILSYGSKRSVLFGFRGSLTRYDPVIRHCRIKTFWGGGAYMKTRVWQGCKRFFITILLSVTFSGVVQASTVFQTTGFISGIEGQSFTFLSGQEEDAYRVTLSDLSFAPLAFDFLGISISTSIETVGFMEGTGAFLFDVQPNSLYYANVFGVGSGPYETGLYGLEITTTPIPTSLWIFGSGLGALIFIRRRRR
jgi:hypothetical protein